MFVGDVRGATVGSRVLLVVVGRQPVVLGTDEIGEVAPRPPGQRPQERLLLGAQARRRRAQGPADPPADDGRHQPQHQHRDDERPVGQAGVRHEDQHHRQGDGQSGADPHLEKEALRCAARVAAAVRGHVPQHADRAG